MIFITATPFFLTLLLSYTNSATLATCCLGVLTTHTQTEMGEKKIIKEMFVMARRLQ